MEKKILIVEDKYNLRKVLKQHLENSGFKVAEANSLYEAKKACNNLDISFALLDIRLPDGNGISLIPEFKEKNITCIVMSAYGDIPLAVDSIKKGATDFLCKPFDPEILIKMINSKIFKKKNQNEDYIDPVGNSEIWKNILNLADKISKKDTTILLEGETGSGKEVVARYIHNNSKRQNKKFIAVNCAAIPKELIESELFGAAAEAYTGISKSRVGKFEAANNGTLFLDEIGDLSLDAQSKILRIIETMELQKLGSNKVTKVNIRIIAATNKNLNEEIKKNNFRNDLYFRLSIFPIKLPPLRERISDVEILSQHLIERIKKKSEIIKKIELSQEALQKLRDYTWPGNIRELSNVLERAIIIIKDNTIEKEDIILPKVERFSSIKIAKVEREIEMIKNILNETKWNKTLAAKKLGISYRSFLEKIKKYNINKNKN